MLKELAGADRVLKLMDAPATRGSTNVITNHVSRLTQLIQQQTMESNADATEHESTAHSDSNSSVHHCGHGDH